MNETADNILNKAIDNATSRLKIPIVSTYVVVLIFNSWDIIYYLLFQSGDALSKIKYIKENHTDYWSIVSLSLLYAIIVLMLFTILDTGLAYGLRNVYKLKKKLTDDIDNYKTNDFLNLEVQTAKIEIKSLNKTIDDLLTQNENLVIENKQLQINNSRDLKDLEFGKIISDIFMIDGDRTLLFKTFIKTITLLNYQFIKSNNFNISLFYTKFETIEEQDMARLIIQILYNNKILSSSKDSSNYIIDADKFKELRNYTSIF